MPVDVLERLSRANPIPADLPAAPIEPLLARLDQTPTRSPHRLTSAITVAVSVVVVAIVVILSLGTNHASVPSPGDRDHTPTIAPALLANFRLVRRSHQAADSQRVVGLDLGVCQLRHPLPKVLPARAPYPTFSTNPNASLCIAGPTTVQRRYGLEHPTSSQVRHASIPGTEIQTWLIAGTHGACWNAVKQRSTSVIGERCFSSPEAQTKLLVGTVPRPGSSGSEVGLVTDRVLGLQIHRQNGTASPVSIHDNYFYTTYSRGDQLTARTRKGNRVIQDFR